MICKKNILIGLVAISPTIMAIVLLILSARLEMPVKVVESDISGSYTPIAQVESMVNLSIWR